MCRYRWHLDTRAMWRYRWNLYARVCVIIAESDMRGYVWLSLKIICARYVSLLPKLYAHTENYVRLLCLEIICE